jgi:4-amino-4-deoxy-L-arabinose transferase-like glycosyltransferase
VSGQAREESSAPALDDGAVRSSEGRENLLGGPWVALAALLAIAIALRVVGLRYGLPFALLNPDEQSIVPRAWRMVHGAGADPHWFDYPTLVMYLLAPFQLFHAVPSYVAGRIVVAALGVGTVGAAWWLGRRSYGTVAGAVAAAVTAVETTMVAYSHMAVTDVPLVLGVTISLAFAVGGQLELAGLAAGLAAGTKYPGVFLLVPLVVAGWGRWWRLTGSVLLAFAAFLATSPFVTVHPGQAAHEAFRIQRLARQGWLGFEHDHWAGIAFTARLWHGLGPALIIAALGVAVALVRRTRTDLVLVSFAAVYFIDLLTLHAHFDRYLLPLVPVLGVLAGRLRSLAPVTLLLLVVPLTWSVRDDRRLLRTDTRVVAQRWIERNLPQDSEIAAESSTPPLPGFPVLPLALPGPKRPFDPNRNVARLRERGVRYVLVTGAVADRVLAARTRYPREAGFYDELRRSAHRVYRLDPGRHLAGPWVAVYRL